MNENLLLLKDLLELLKTKFISIWAVSKNVCIDKLNDILHDYKNTYHITI